MSSGVAALQYVQYNKRLFRFTHGGLQCRLDSGAVTIPHLVTFRVLDSGAVVLPVELPDTAPLPVTVHALDSGAAVLVELPVTIRLPVTVIVCVTVW